MRRLLAFLFILLSPAAGLWFAAQAPVRVVVMHTNDLHGQLLPNGEIGGMAEIATVVRQTRPDLLLDAGDVSTGTLLSDEFKNEPNFLAMNRIGYTAGTVGNHEFDQGQPALRALLRLAAFPVLAANLDTPIKEIKKYVVVPAKGLRFGIVGLTTEDLRTTTHPKNLNRVKVRDIVKTLEKLLPEIRRQSDFIIATTHLDDAEELRLARAFPEIRLIIGGHNHAALGPIPVGRTLIAKTGSSGRNVGRVDLEFSGRSLLRQEASLIPVKGFPPNPEVAQVFKPYDEKVREKMSRVLGEATDALVSSSIEESPLGNFIADAIREKTGTQIAFHNTGGIRSTIKKGEITWGDVFAVLPFQNTLITLKLTGAQLKEALQIRGARLVVSGIRVQLDRKDPSGWQLMSAVLVDGTPIENSKLYTVTTNDFLVAGGDGLSGLAKGRDIRDTGLLLRDVIADYIQNRRVLTPKVDGRLELSR